MTTDELRTLAVAKQLDARGVSCPGPLLETKRAITGVPSGGVMEILSSDCGTPSDLGRWAAKVGHEYLGELHEDGHYRIFLRVR